MQTSPPPPAGRAQRDHDGRAGAARPGSDGLEDELGWLGDAIDDRVAELLPELLAEQEAPRPGGWQGAALAVLGLSAALVASVVLRGSLLAVCVAWLSTAAVCLAAARLAGARRR